MIRGTGGPPSEGQAPHGVNSLPSATANNRDAADHAARPRCFTRGRSAHTVTACSDWGIHSAVTRPGRPCALMWFLFRVRADGCPTPILRSFNGGRSQTAAAIAKVNTRGKVSVPLRALNWRRRRAAESGSQLHEILRPPVRKRLLRRRSRNPRPRHPVATRGPPQRCCVRCSFA